MEGKLFQGEASAADAVNLDFLPWSHGGVACSPEVQSDFPFESLAPGYKGWSPSMIQVVVLIFPSSRLELLC